MMDYHRYPQSFSHDIASYLENKVKVISQNYTWKGCGHVIYLFEDSPRHDSYWAVAEDGSL